MASLTDALIKHNMLGQDTRAATVAVAPIFLMAQPPRRMINRISGGLSQQIGNLQSYTRRIVSTLRTIAAEKIKQQITIERIDRQIREDRIEAARLQPESRVERVEEKDDDESNILSSILRILGNIISTIAQIASTVLAGIRRAIQIIGRVLPIGLGLVSALRILIGSPIGRMIAGAAAIAGAAGSYMLRRGAIQQREREGEPGAITAPEGDFGSLARRFESRGDPGAVGRDTNGGYSYGTYQIATRTGTMNNFMNWLRNRNPSAAEELDRAGGVNGAASGSPEFIDAWRRLSQNQTFVENQRQFITETHYVPAVNNILTDTGINISSRSRALQEAVNSTAIQHGPAGARRIVTRAINEAGGRNATDEEIINRIYDIRSDVTREFRSSSPREQEAVRNRFIQEREMALRMLQQETTTAGQRPIPRPVSMTPTITPSVQQTATYIPPSNGAGGLVILPVLVGA